MMVGMTYSVSKLEHVHIAETVAWLELSDAPVKLYLMWNRANI